MIVDERHAVDEDGDRDDAGAGDGRSAGVARVALREAHADDVPVHHLVGLCAGRGNGDRCDRERGCREDRGGRPSTESPLALC